MSNVATKAKKPNLSVKSVLNWILDHAMIIVIVLLALYVQTQRDAFLKPASLINIISLTAARLPMAKLPACFNWRSSRAMRATVSTSLPRKLRSSATT